MSPLTQYDTRPRCDQRLLGNLSQSSRLRRNYSQRRGTQTGLSLHQRRQARVARRRASMGRRHPRHRRPFARESSATCDARVLCIGPAGENMNRAAMLANDYNHFAAHSGGAVLGSKKLKAIVVCGTLRPSHRDKAKLATPACAGASVLQQHERQEKRKPSTATAMPGAH